MKEIKKYSYNTENDIWEFFSKDGCRVSWIRILPETTDTTLHYIVDTLGCSRDFLSKEEKEEYIKNTLLTYTPGTSGLFHLARNSNR